MTKTATIGAYSLYSGSYALTPDQITTSKFGISVGTYSDNFKSTALTGSCSALSGSGPVAYSYVGCYTDDVNSRTFSAATNSDNNMTLSECSNFCSGYQYFGTEYTTQCFCGTTLSSSGTEAAEAECSMPCGGDSTETCGGPNRLSVYTNNNYVTPGGATIPGYQYVGCYNDTAAARSLSGTYTYSNDMTVEACATFCNGATYFGVEYYDECYCGETLAADSAKQPVADCSYPCSGNKSEFCGGSNRLDLYQLGSSIVTTTSSPVSPNNPPTTIASLSTTITTPVTSTTASTSTVPSSSSTTVSTSASTTTSLDPVTSSSKSITDPPSSSTTAPVNLSAISSTTVSTSVTITTPFVGWLTMGCYSDSVAARVLQNEGIVEGGPANMTVENCEAACLAAGYILAGVEYSAECYCDSAIRNGGATATDGYAQCTMTCNGNATEQCGGPNRLNIFQYTSPSTSTTVASIVTSTTVVVSTTTSGVLSTTVPSTTTTSATTSATGLPGGWTYQGCYVDNIGGVRSMLVQENDNPTMTIESCINLCLSLGYTVAGMEYSDQCFCDDYVRNNASLASSDSQCAMTCAGNINQICGGPNLLSIYSSATITVLPPPTVQITDLPGSWVYKGCLQYVPVLLILSLVMELILKLLLSRDNVNNTRTFPYMTTYTTNNSATACLSRCQEYGFQAAGMEYGEQCCKSLFYIAKLIYRS